MISGNDGMECRRTGGRLKWTLVPSVKGRLRGRRGKESDFQKRTWCPRTTQIEFVLGIRFLLTRELVTGCLQLPG